MNADMSDHTPFAKLRKGLRAWWLTPPRSGVYGWAAFFLAIAALNLGGGYWYLTLTRSAPARP